MENIKESPQLPNVNSVYRRVGRRTVFVTQLTLSALFALLTILGSANASSPSLRCAEGAEAEAQGTNRASPATKSASGGLKLLRETIDGGYRDFRERSIWLAYPRQEPLTQKLVENLLELSPAQRVQALELIRRSPPSDRRLLLVLELSLFDKQAWLSYFDQFSSGPLINDALVNSLVPVLRKMPQTLVNEIYAQIAPRYASLSKRNFSVIPPRKNLRLAPKRAIDAFVFHTMRPDQVIAQEFAATGNAQMAYGRYLKKLRKALFADSVAGQYDVSDVLTIGKAIQRVLRSEDAREFDDPVVSVTGSVPNGRAKLATSDLDTQLSDRGITRLFPLMDIEVNSDLKSKYPEAKLETHAMWETTTEHFAAQINPIFLRVTKNEISIEVYGPFSPLNRDQNLMPYNYPAPKRYVLLAEPEAKVRTANNQRSKDASQSFTYKQILSDIEAGLPQIPKETRWLDNPYVEPVTMSFVEGLLRLSSKERSTVANKVRAKSATLSPKVSQLLGLALFDPVTWSSYVDFVASKAQTNDAVYNALAPVLSAMPAALRSDLFIQINSRYADASKQKYVRTFPFFQKKFLALAPKRALDVLISQLLDPAARIKERVSAGKSILQAYDQVLAMQKRRVLGGLENGNYEAQDVMTAARAIQAVVRQKATAGEEWSMTLAGSFTSGRAKLTTSDIDIMFSNPAHEAYLEQMTTDVRAALKPRHPDVGLEVHAMFSTTTEVNAAVVAPLMVRITPDTIELIAYPPIRALERDDFMLPQNYPLPDLYMLEQNGAGASSTRAPDASAA